MAQISLFAVQDALGGNNSSIRVFSGIPFVELSVVKHCFKPPTTREPESSVLDATWFGPNCVQLDTEAKTVYTEYQRGFLLAPSQQQSADCLTIKV